MAVKFQDYYEVLGISRTATQEEIQRAYRKLARQYHPDVNKSTEAEDRFKRIGEAYEVLKDPEKRQKYDRLGANWQQGQDFRPPPGWETFRSGSGGNSWGFGFDDIGEGGFSDFFEVLFGRGFQSSGAQMEGNSGFSGNTIGKGQDQEAEIAITLEEAYHGVKKSLTLQREELNRRGRAKRSTQTLEVTVPPGTLPGTRLRLSGQGAKGLGRSPAGDLYLKVTLQPHHRFSVNGADLETQVPVTPSEAALGARIQVPLVDGKAWVTLRPGTPSGHRLRLKGKGMKPREKQAGDLYAEIRITVPPKLGERERELYEKLAEVSSYHPRGKNN